MTYTYVLTNTTGQVRLLIPDRVEADAFFSDEEIAAFLALEGANVRRAAAMALETMASSEAYVQKAIRVLDLSTNGPATAASLLDRAARLRAQALEAEAAEDGGAFDIAEVVYDDFSARQRLENEALRDL
jgi:hypothetical protein